MTPAEPEQNPPWWRRHVRILIAACVAVVASAATVVVVLARSGNGAGDLRVDNPTGTSAGGAIPDIDIGLPYMYLLLPLCTAGGPATITDVSPHDLTGRLTVVDWAAVPHAALTYRDAVPGRARDLLGPDSTSTITWKCSTETGGSASAFAVGISLGSARAVARGWDVQSTSGTVYVPFTIVECTAATCPAPRR